MNKVNTWAWIIGTSLFALFVASFAIYWHWARVVDDLIIAHEVEQLARIFQQIDADTGIIGFEHDRNYIDFLNVVKFVGSEVGSMNVKNPADWKGPYLHDNPTYQEKYYEIIKTNDGYYIVPGYGVKLNNGKIIGQDFGYSADMNIVPLMHDENFLQYKGKPLSAKLTLIADKPVELPVPVVVEAG